MPPLEIHRVGRYQAAEARGVVIVIDVVRAFSVAAYAFAGGASKLWLVRTVEEALALRERESEALVTGTLPPGSKEDMRPLLAGEVGGRLIAGFDFNNSPACMAKADVKGRVLIQRTGAGTQGALAVAQATHLLLCALVNARATAAYARKLAETTNGLITLHPTCDNRDDDLPDEDKACADYLEALLAGREDARAMLEQGIERVREVGRFEPFEQGSVDFPWEDIPAVLNVDKFGFAMVGKRKRWEGIDYVEVEKAEVASPRSHE